MKKILVPIDFSKPSEHAAKLAAKIAKKANSEVHLLHMVELPTGIIDLGIGNNFSIPESMLYIRKVRERILEYRQQYFSNDESVKYAIRFQNPYDGICDYVKKHNIDFIIMGAKGHTPLEEILIGSNTEKVVRTSEVPVLVTKKNGENFNPKNLVFASSFKPEKNQAFERFLEFASNFDSNIHLLKINTPQRFEDTLNTNQRIQKFIDKYDLNNYSINIYNDSSIEKGILSFSNKINADIIALATHGRSGLSHIFNGSITKHLAKKSIKPMLTFKV
ncbi:universal stress protein [Tenacibaculum caenipelagi]|uniref:Nucleotide-binding universal stress UspA family protein n=1 Tax=Tenacibaculum caenipelagi TaxID=1325435 RepID=A0A4R6TAZ0_9FLAO|nr:universal stress protein [Tenacibaculum caenipelagi]TDQ22069.1 nucleotide-binding universal stress UspA family protein [Tenacibaculum caenipelagi]